MLAILFLQQAHQLFFVKYKSDDNGNSKPEGEHAARRLYVTGEYAVSHTVLLTDCIILYHWFVALMGIHVQNRFFLWLTTLQNSSYKCINYVLLTIYVWFVTPSRKPPDHSTSINVGNMITRLVYLIEDSLNYVLNKDINIMFWSSFIIAQLPYLRTNMFAEKQHINAADKYFYESRTTNVYKTKPIDIVKRYEGSTLISNVVLSWAAELQSNESYLETMPLDTDSYQFAVDTGTTFHVCRHKELFVGNIRKAKSIYIKGIGGRIKVKGYGTIKIRVIDDDSNNCDLEIANVLYVPNSPANLISPQLWSECSAKPTGTGEITVGGMTLMFWDEHKHSMLIPHHNQLKLPIFLANKNTTLSSFVASADQHQCARLPVSLNTSTPVLSMELQGNQNIHIIPLDDDDHSFHEIHQPKKAIVIDELDQLEIDRGYTAPSSPIQHPNDKIMAADDSILTNESSSTMPTINDTSSVDDGISTAQSIFSDTDSTCVECTTTLDEAAHELVHGQTEDQKEWLQYHYALKHLPISSMKRLAENGVIPKRLAKIKPPICVACLKGKQHRTPWRGRGKKVSHIRKPHHNFPGAQTSSDQMISPFGGMVPQMKGRLTKAKYYAATVFVDHHTDYTYVHLMRDTTAVSTLEAKHAYETLMMTYGHRVMAYHADNGRYAENAFRKDAKDKAQTLSFCGAGKHSQNGIAERRIKSLSEDSRTMLAHGMQLWPQAITKTLWPFAIKAACRSRNHFKLDSDGLSPAMKLSGVRTKVELRNEHPLFCPVFTLDKDLQSGMGAIPKWNPRSNAGIYLGHSPKHASNVALVLNLTTGLVSPQYHVVFDDTFSTVDYITNRTEPSHWENLCKFHSEDYQMLPSATR